MVRERLAAAVEVVTDTVGWLSEHGVADVRNALAGATPFLRMFGLLVGARYLAEAALAAKADLDAGIGDAEYLEARIVIARFYAGQPAAGGRRPGPRRHRRVRRPLRGGPRRPRRLIAVLLAADPVGIALGLDPESQHPEARARCTCTD